MKHSVVTSYPKISNINNDQTDDIEYCNIKFNKVNNNLVDEHITTLNYTNNKKEKYLDKVDISETESNITDNIEHVLRISPIYTKANNNIDNTIIDENKFSLNNYTDSLTTTFPVKRRAPSEMESVFDDLPDEIMAKPTPLNSEIKNKATPIINNKNTMNYRLFVL